MASGFGNGSGGNAIFFNVTKGKFKFRTKKDGDYEFCDTVWADSYEAHTLRFKEAEGEYEAHDELVIKLKGVDKAGNPATYYITSYFPSSWAKMIISCLPAVKKGMPVVFRVWAPKDGNGNVSLGLVYGMTPSGDQIKLDRDMNAPKFDPAARELRVKAGATAIEQKKIKRKILEEESEIVDAWARPILTDHECWLDEDDFKNTRQQGATTTVSHQSSQGSNHANDEEFDPFADS